MVLRAVCRPGRVGYALGLLAAVGCASADPVVTGYLIEEAPEDSLPSPSVPSNEPPGSASGSVMFVPESLGSLERPALSAQPGLLSGLHGGDALVVDPVAMCEERPEPCGGELEGTWVVSATCSAESTNRDSLDRWGKALMDLTADVCSGSVRLLTTRWVGELEFGAGWVDDARRREAVADVEIGAECLTATLDGVGTIAPSDSTCAALDDERTSCVFTRGRCVCTSVHELEGDTTGLYQPGDENNVVVQGSNIRRSYDYCVDGERMIWWENSGLPRPGGMVMRRKRVQDRTLVRGGEGNIVTIPREDILRATQAAAEAEAEAASDGVQGDSGE